MHLPCSTLRHQHFAFRISINPAAATAVRPRTNVPGHGPVPVRAPSISRKLWPRSPPGRERPVPALTLCPGRSGQSPPALILGYSDSGIRVSEYFLFRRSSCCSFWSWFTSVTGPPPRPGHRSAGNRRRRKTPDTGQSDPGKLCSVSDSTLLAKPGGTSYIRINRVSRIGPSRRRQAGVILSTT